MEMTSVVDLLLGGAVVVLALGLLNLSRAVTQLTAIFQTHLEYHELHARAPTRRKAPSGNKPGG
jgi:hypothetical protein